MRKIYVVLCLSLLLYNCQKPTEAETSLIHLIPKKSAAILRVPDREGFKNSIQSSKLVSLISNTNLYKEFESYASLFKDFNWSEEFYLAFVALGEDDYDLALITHTTKDFAKDSTFTKKLTSYAYEGTNINSFKRGDKDLHFIHTGGFLIVSTSKLILENSILQANTGRDPIDQSLAKILKTSNTKSPNLFIKGSYYKSLFKKFIDYHKFSDSKTPFSWLAVDLELNTDRTALSGVINYKPDNSQSLALLKNLKPSASDAPRFTPVSALGYTTFSYQDWETYKENLSELRGALLKEFKLPLETFLNLTTAISLVENTDKSSVITRVSEPTEAEIALAPYSKKIETYRELTLFSLSDSLAFKSNFKELLNIPAVNYYCQFDSFFVFTQSIEGLKDLVANYQNGAVLENDQAFKRFKEQMSDASNLEYFSINKNMVSNLNANLSPKVTTGLKELELSNFPYAGIQLTADSDFIYINGSIRETKIARKKSQVTQIASVKLDSELLSAPQMLKNYRTKGQNILVQDVRNTLYQINQNGKIDWKKELDGPIIGRIQQVDIYKNGRLQYAFVTPNHLYLIASNGNEVKQFDKSFDQKITQPLAVFDYDGSRSYRFVITQGQNLTMLDQNAKIVSGFEYTKAPANVINIPQHLRLGTKDYLLFQLENGKLEILDRRGHTRIKLNETFQFSKNQIFEKNGSFLIIEDNGSIASITQSGKISRNTNKGTKNLLFDQTGNLTATLNDNILKINTNELELELGIYAGLKCFRVHNTFYVTLTNLQTNQIFIYDKAGKMLPNFPVYAASPVDLGNSGKSKNLLFTAQGEPDSVLIYQINL